MLKLKYLRLRGGMSQAQLEKELGLTHQIYSAIENGRLTRPYYSTVMKLQNIFSVPIEMILAEALPEEIEESLKFEREMRVRSGKKGGTVTSVVYGRKHMKEIGRRGAKASATKIENQKQINRRRKEKANQRTA